MINPLTAGGYICGFISSSLAARTCIEAFHDGRISLGILARYPRRLKRTPHYIIIRAAAGLMKASAYCQRRFAFPLYQIIFGAYFRLVHRLLRIAHPISN